MARSSIGQGLSSAVGLAIAEAHLGAVFGSQVFDHYTYVFCGDGCLMEGITAEGIRAREEEMREKREKRRESEGEKREPRRKKERWGREQRNGKEAKRRKHQLSLVLQLLLSLDILV